MTAQDGIAGTAVGRGASGLTEGGLTFAEARSLSAETLGLLNVASGTVYFPNLERKTDALFFKFAEGWKARSTIEKAHVAGGGFKPSFWNLERVVRSNAPEIYITEGELDACALVEAGVPPDRVLSVPNGAREKPAENPDEVKGYQYARDALPGLVGKKRIVWCGDSDGPGIALRSDMARILGIARFWFVEWPEGCKDANDYLRSDGAEALQDRVTNGALPWPIKGSYRLSQIPIPAPLTLWRPGFDEWESKVMLAPRTLSVVTGQPGHGKTQLWQQIWFQVAKAYGVSVAIASFETRPRPHIQRQLRSLYIGQLEKHMTDEERARADAWIEERYLFFIHDEQRPTLEWFLEMAEVAVVRDGVRVVQIDPWNRLEDQRTRDESKTDYIGRCLRSMHAFAHDMNCHVQVLAHPAKMDGNRRNTPPQLEDISDSKNWENMVDQGFVVHRPEVFDGTERKTEAVLYHRKARFEELGHPCKLMMNYDIQRGRYVSTDYENAR